MYIGTSLGRCLSSILAGEVSEKDVICIITRTKAETYPRFVKVIEDYHSFGNPYANNSEGYVLSNYELEDVLTLANTLWYSGKIHQPRVFFDESRPNTIKIGAPLWLEIVPTNTSSNPVVVEAYEKYRVLASLMA
jgi:hypothetical protein